MGVPGCQVSRGTDGRQLRYAQWRMGCQITPQWVLSDRGWTPIGRSEAAVACGIPTSTRLGLVLMDSATISTHIALFGHNLLDSTYGLHDLHPWLPVLPLGSLSSESGISCDRVILGPNWVQTEYY